jgi:hypothetical protein
MLNHKKKHNQHSQRVTRDDIQVGDFMSCGEGPAREATRPATTSERANRTKYSILKNIMWHPKTPQNTRLFGKK